jgi:hypothetical protein
MPGIAFAMSWLAGNAANSIPCRIIGSSDDGAGVAMLIWARNRTSTGSHRRQSWH